MSLSFSAFRTSNSRCSDDQGEPESEEEEGEEEDDVAEALAKLTACHIVPADKPSPLRSETTSLPRQHDEKDRQSEVCGCIVFLSKLADFQETPQQAATSSEMSSVRECAREITQRLKVRRL